MLPRWKASPLTLATQCFRSFSPYHPYPVPPWPLPSDSLTSPWFRVALAASTLRQAATSAHHHVLEAFEPPMLLCHHLFLLRPPLAIFRKLAHACLFINLFDTFFTIKKRASWCAPTSVSSSTATSLSPAGGLFGTSLHWREGDHDDLSLLGEAQKKRRRWYREKDYERAELKRAEGTTKGNEHREGCETRKS